jgi:hypothetical protein
MPSQDIFTRMSNGIAPFCTGGCTILTGKGERYETATCAHCGGIGCSFCDKTGCVLVAAPKRICPHCEGIGCIYCGFTGWAGLKGKYD